MQSGVTKNSFPRPAWLQADLHYQQRFQQAASHFDALDPLHCKEELVQRVHKVLGLNAIPRPVINVTNSRGIAFENVKIEALSGESWSRCPVSALWIRPAAAADPRPTVLICCGHGADGKRTRAYTMLGLQLAMQGVNVLIPDNIGQGERQPMGHRLVRQPFAAGFTLQGMIVQETQAWIDWLIAQPEVDPQQLAASGNSGGGTLTMFLAALEPRIKAMTSSGYPSLFSFIAAKEKQHCACNLLPGVLSLLEMWQLYGLFAPKPLYIFQGSGDSLFPVDLFLGCAARIGNVYRDAGAPDQFHSELCQGQHSWDDVRVRKMGAFYANLWNLSAPSDVPIDNVMPTIPFCYPSWPTNALDTDQLAARIGGLATPVTSIKLADIFQPPTNLTLPDEDFGRTDWRNLAAQYECFLHPFE